MLKIINFTVDDHINYDNEWQLDTEIKNVITAHEGVNLISKTEIVECPDCSGKVWTLNIKWFSNYGKDVCMVEW